MKKRIKIGAVMVLALLLALTSSLPAAALLRRGNRGEEVKALQQALKNHGYAPGKIDGIFGPTTEQAVKAFQKDYGLQVDGLVGQKTSAALGLDSRTGDSDYRLLARVISAEARGEPYVGQVAVGAVILNRVEHPSFPDTLSGVVFQNGAFTCMVDGQYGQAVSESAYAAARDAINGYDPTGGAIYYYNPATATNQWIRSRPVVYAVGRHVFCR